MLYLFQAGIIEEMLEDTFEGMEEDDVEEAAQEEVDKILFEVTKGKEQKMYSLTNTFNMYYMMVYTRLKLSHGQMHLKNSLTCQNELVTCCVLPRGLFGARAESNKGLFPSSPAPPFIFIPISFLFL